MQAVALSRKRAENAGLPLPSNQFMPILRDGLTSRDSGEGKIVNAASLSHVPASPGYHDGIVSAERKRRDIERDAFFFRKAGKFLPHHTVGGHAASHYDALRLEKLHGASGLDGEGFRYGEKIGGGSVAKFLRGGAESFTGRRLS